MGVPVSRMERPSPVSALLSIKVADWSPLQPPDVTVTCRKVLPDCLVSLPLLAVSELWPVCPRQQQNGPLPVHRSDMEGNGRKNVGHCEIFSQRTGAVRGARWAGSGALRATGRGPVVNTGSAGMTDRPGSTTAPVTSGGKVRSKT